MAETSPAVSVSPAHATEDQARFMANTDEQYWFKDAIIYRLHVKTFFDADDDGIGDFAGLIVKLDHIQELGAGVIWPLPFFPSPLRDDGYDIADHRNVHPDHGTLDDFRRFVTKAHARGIRVMIELVVNHTSDRHPWFQRARTSPPGSVERGYHVWSDSDERCRETRVIFVDTETALELPPMPRTSERLAAVGQGSTT